LDLKDPTEGKTQDVSVTALTGVTANDADGFTATRLKYSAYKSNTASTKLARDRWYMLSPALQDVVSGDFAFGDYPRVYMRKFNNVSPAQGGTSLGTWTNSFPDQAVPLNPMEGFVVWVNKYQNSFAYKESGTDAISGTPEEPAIDDEDVASGLQAVNGILELPFYENPEMSTAHRIHLLDGNKSYFYYVWADNNSQIDLTTNGDGKPDTYERTANSYRLIDGASPSYSVAGVPVGGQIILVGNPFMSTIDVAQFLSDNTDVLEQYFSLYEASDGHYEVYNTSSETPTATIGASQYVAPMQSFLVTVKPNRAIDDIIFNASIQSSANKTPLRSSESAVEQDIIRIRATNAEHTAETLVGQRANAGNGYVSSEDVYKLFTQNLNIPEIFTVADKYKLVMNFIPGDSEQTIPIGLKSDLLGQTTLSLTGMDHYAAEKIEFIDVAANQTIDITGKERYEYPFNHQIKGLEEGRFFLRVQGVSTGIKTPEAFGVQVYETAEGIKVLSATSDPILQIELYTVDGQRIYNNAAVNNWLYTVTNRWVGERILIVRVVTTQGVSSVKLIKK
jgi:hypothetical protein